MGNPEIMKLLNTFAKVTKMRLLLVDSKFRAIEDVGFYNEDFCSHIHNSKKCLMKCINSDKHGFKTVSKTGKPYKYTCPFGFFQGIVPVKKGGKSLYYLFTSTVMEMKNEPDIENKLINKVLETDSGFDAENLLKHIKKIDLRQRENLDACFDMLCILGEYISNNVRIDFKEKSLAETVKGYIDNNFDTRITLAKLSAFCHYSTVSITEHFYKEFGMTVMEYLLIKRIDCSKVFLEQTNLQVNEIAEKCGFADSEYFSKCFKKVTGTTPGKWRKKQE